MKFIVKDCDPISGEVQEDGYQEDYRVYTILYYIYILAIVISIKQNCLYISFKFK